MFTLSNTHSYWNPARERHRQAIYAAVGWGADGGVIKEAVFLESRIPRRPSSAIVEHPCLPFKGNKNNNQLEEEKNNNQLAEEKENRRVSSVEGVARGQGTTTHFSGIPARWTGQAGLWMPCTAPFYPIDH